MTREEAINLKDFLESNGQVYEFQAFKNLVNDIRAFTKDTFFFYGIFRFKVTKANSGILEFHQAKKLNRYSFKWIEKESDEGKVSYVRADSDGVVYDEPFDE